MLVVIQLSSLRLVETLSTFLFDPTTYITSPLPYDYHPHEKFSLYISNAFTRLFFNKMHLWGGNVV